VIPALPLPFGLLMQGGNWLSIGRRSARPRAVRSLMRWRSSFTGNTKHGKDMLGKIGRGVHNGLGNRAQARTGF
jgi:hypothetical protein